MKSCPTCNRTFADDTLTFCLVDGSILSAPYDPQTTRPYPRAHRNEPPPTERLQTSPQLSETTLSSPAPHPTIPAQPLIITPANKQSESFEKRGKRRWLAVGIVASLALVIGLAFVLSQNLRSGKDDSVAKQPNNNLQVTNQNVQPAAIPTATPQTTTSPENTAPVERIDMTGTWTGELAGASTTLLIDSQKGNSFSGTLSQPTYLIAFVGSIDPATRTVTMRDTKALKGNDWKLGVNTGSISSGGKSMSGTGKGYITYSWAFSKQ